MVYFNNHTSMLIQKRFNMLKTKYIILATLSFAFMPPTLQAEETISYEDTIIPLVDKYCAECHNDRDHEGDLDLERFETTESVVNSIALWDRGMLRVKNNEMPPKNELKPTDEEKELLKTWIEQINRDSLNCNHIASEQSVSWYPGYVMSRRLNRAEFEYTLGDLLGVDIKVSHLFPADGSGGEGFNNNGSALFLSAIQLEKYLEAADIAIETAIPSGDTQDDVAPSVTSALDSSVIASVAPRNSVVQTSLIPATPAGGQDPYRLARSAIHDFAQRAWRRPIEDDETDRLLAMFGRAFTRGDSYRESVKLAFKAVLISPNFLFLVEPEPDLLGDYMLGGYPLASRLSYFLWASMPDEELLAHAAAGDLNDEVVLRAQVKRMLADPRSIALGEQFAMQWLGIDQFAEITKPDPNRFPEFTEVLAESMRQEAIMSFGRIFQEDRSLLELIDTDWIYANQPLAEIYGIENISGDEMRAMQSNDPKRGGVVGMAAILTETSHALRTSPVLRGKWVLNQLLGENVPAPPPNVPALPEDDHDLNGLTFRQTLEVHRENPACASCHDRMDPIGFGMENYDPIGRWRDTQGGLPVDSKGVLPSGEAFEGPVELKSILMKRKDQFAKNLSRKMLGYALGRNLTKHDTCVVNDSMEALKADEFRASNLITEIVLSYPFRHRYSNGKT
jgi:hypothetical protein